MRVVDANVLLYAVNSDARHHEASRTWLDRALGGGDSVGLSWMALLAFVRIATKGGLFPHPLTVEDAMAQVGEWLDQPGAHLVQPGRAHAAILSRLLRHGGGGNLVNDAHLAALAVEHRADVVSYDTDFARFDEVAWRRPEDLL
ncbi:type II toxin-antitoxin system VapC family toxin [Nocardioides massiliensis]|uniref:Ribonuclease VapC n=1 Tax=Nocardioides massiliensis TaxID=1325935 RepID=A0ABT9NRN4_9ACTN|nr:type II toxin-antitoxin system VapC family toxin [Nocardioides massiliensis]MDP9822976.1 toxin-antitoxin system PIN domain toxin [Nocardioides massiliensis]